MNPVCLIPRFRLAVDSSKDLSGPSKVVPTMACTTAMAMQLLVIGVATPFISSCCYSSLKFLGPSSARGPMAIDIKSARVTFRGSN